MQPDRSALARALLCIGLVACTTPAPTANPSRTPVETATGVVGTTVPSPPVRPTPSAMPTLAPNELHPDELSAAVDRAAIERHLVALAEITERHGGDRLTGSAGFTAALRYVTETLEDAGYAVEKLRFSHGSVGGANVVAERTGARAGIVMIGAHLDTVAGSPGMNDDASGVAALLAIAEAMRDLPPPERTIRLAIWDAEEGGPFGSRAYVESLSVEERDRIVAYLNLDLIGAPNPLRLVYDEADAAPGSEAITRRFIEVLDEHALAWEPIDLDGDSDHGPFADAGIPTGGIFAGGHEPVTEAEAQRFGAQAGVPADACVHRPCDTIDNVDAATIAELGAIAAQVLVELARAGG